jgi:DNA-binding NarL/FixJ family response regulator
MSDKPTVRIMIINDDFAETKNIQEWMRKDMRIPWSSIHCVNTTEAIPRANKVDLIILKPQLEGLPTPKEVYSAVEDLMFEIPIIVLANLDDEHELSTYVMEHGAADIVVRGRFSRLVDAVEFALIRQQIATGTRKTADKTLSNSEKENPNSTVSLNANEEKQKQILRMFSGDYSVELQED